jgi:hypothetical protein
MKIIKIIENIFNVFINFLAKSCEERDRMMYKLTPEQRLTYQIDSNWLDF